MENYDVCMILSDPFINDSRVLKEARSLARHGLRVKLLALSDVQTPDHEYVAGFDVERVRVASRRLPKTLSLLRSFFVLAEYYVRTWLKAFSTHAKIFHSHDLIPLPIAWSVSRWTGVKVIYDTHELEIDRNAMPSFQKWINRKLEKFLVSRVDRIIVSDGDSRARAMLTVHRVQRKYDVVKNCPAYVDVGTRHSEDLKNILNIERNTHILFYIGALSPNHGLEQVIDSLVFLPDNVVFVTMGRRVSAFEAVLLERARERGVGNRLHFLDPISPDKVPLYAFGATIGMVLIQNSSLSYYYSAPTKMFECMMAGLPQIASDFPEIRKVVIENPVGPIGRVVDPSNPRAIAECIRSLLFNMEALETYRRNARILSKEHYNWENQEAILLGLYGELM